MGDCKHPSILHTSQNGEQAAGGGGGRGHLAGLLGVHLRLLQLLRPLLDVCHALADIVGDVVHEFPPSGPTV